MGTRRIGREAAFQLLYQIEISGADYEYALDEFWLQSGVPHKSREFTLSLVKGVLENLKKIDKLIADNSLNWKMSRMNQVDKGVLRQGVYELAFCPETPTKVIINEAIEIAKKYGTNESGAFVNGILDKIAREVRGDEQS